MVRSADRPANEPSTDGAAPDAGQRPPEIAALQLATGHWVAQCVSVASELKIPDILAGAPRTAAEIAAVTETDPAAMLRLLRALATFAIVRHLQDGRFEATSLSEQLRQDVPGLGPYARNITGAEYYRAWGELLSAVRTGQTAFDRVFGRPLFGYFAENPDRGRIFNDAMSAFSGIIAEQVVDAHDFSRYRTVFDIGGGQGSLLATILRRSPKVKGTLFDLPHVVEQSQPVLEDADITERCSVIGGDFFESVPEGGDAYVLKMVIHDWDDERSRVILSNCRKAMHPEARLLLLERVITEPVSPTFVDQRAALMDLNMLILTGGRERTESEFAELFASAGFDLERLTAMPSGVYVIEGTPVGPASGD